MAPRRQVDDPKKYEYHAPIHAIAQRPTAPRDAAKLCVVDRRGAAVRDLTFRSLPMVLPPRTVLVMNDTKVIPARIRATKPTGGRVELLYLAHRGRTIQALADRRVVPGDVLRIDRRVTVTVTERDGSVVTLRPSIPPTRFMNLLRRHGRTPLPPYLRHSPLTEAERRRVYQTVFATQDGSVAAPTASLHFTPRLMTALKRSGIQIEYVTLHVGLGTFAPVTDEHLRTNRLHEERYRIPATVAARLNAAKRAGRPIVAVGTTVARTLESATRSGRIAAGAATTSLFIRPGYRWRCVDGLITNFHVPRSSLLMLVAAMIGRERLLKTYQRAIRRGYKLFSFGDGMLIV